MRFWSSFLAFLFSTTLIGVSFAEQAASEPATRPSLAPVPQDPSVLKAHTLSDYVQFFNSGLLDPNPNKQVAALHLLKQMFYERYLDWSQVELLNSNLDAHIFAEHPELKDLFQEYSKQRIYVEAEGGVRYSLAPASFKSFSAEGLANFDNRNLDEDEKKIMTNTDARNADNNLGYCFGIEVLRLDFLRARYDLDRPSSSEQIARDLFSFNPFDVKRPEIQGASLKDFIKGGKYFRNVSLPVIGKFQPDQWDRYHPNPKAETFLSRWRRMIIETQKQRIQENEKDTPIADWKELKFDTLKDELKNEITNGRPFLASFTDKTGGHIVTVYSYVEETGNSNKFYLENLDSNLPHDRLIIIEKESQTGKVSVSFHPYPVESIYFTFLDRKADPIPMLSFPYTRPKSIHEVSVTNVDVTGLWIVFPRSTELAWIPVGNSFVSTGTVVKAIEVKNGQTHILSETGVDGWISSSLLVPAYDLGENPHFPIFKQPGVDYAEKIDFAKDPAFISIIKKRIAAVFRVDDKGIFVLGSMNSGWLFHNVAEQIISKREK